ncbi:hypothetical protein RJ639_024546 [Escallonia herrerae]|uniref:Ty3 transposon capsid-like protein domain-containing protein n=1 Tax=Escallonia herrerae TaxID=1293975 RepID=A0AA89ADY6_9ASTE|nr:hypothetical protein RJ639_024546 [Escallonia herrerae]
MGGRGCEGNNGQSEWPMRWLKVVGDVNLGQVWQVGLGVTWKGSKIPHIGLLDLISRHVTDGERDPTSWTCRASQFFYYHQTPEEERVPLASWNLEGDAQLWYQLLKEEHGEHRITWQVFQDELFERFGSFRYQDFFGDLTKLQQSGTVKEYHTQFSRLLLRAGRLLPEQQVGCFISGLKESLRVDVQSRKPTTLSTAIGLARLWSEDEDDADEEMEIEPNEANEMPEISIHAMCGARVLQTMRAQGKMGQRWVNLYLLPLEGCDAVLGAQWHSTLGPITWDFSKLEMSFKVNGKEVMLQGLKSGDEVIQQGV